MLKFLISHSNLENLDRSLNQVDRQERFTEKITCPDQESVVDGTGVCAVLSLGVLGCCGVVGSGKYSSILVGKTQSKTFLDGEDKL